MRTLLFFLKQAIVTPFFLRRLDFAATEQLAAPQWLDSARARAHPPRGLQLKSK